MPYTPTTWVDDETPLDADNLNHLEGGVQAATATAEAALPAPAAPVNKGPVYWDDATSTWKSALLDDTSFVAGTKIFDPAQLKQNGATVGQALAWDGTDWAPANIAPSKLAQEAASTGKILAWDGTKYAPRRPALATYGGNPLVDVTGASAISETDLFGTAGSGYSLGASVLGTTGGIRITIAGDVLNNGAAATWTLKLRYGANVITGTLAAGASNANRSSYFLQVEMRNLATGRQQWYIHGDVGSGGAGIPSPLGLMTAGTIGLTAFQTTTDSTVAQSLRVTITSNTTSANASWRSFHAAIELI